MTGIYRATPLRVNPKQRTVKAVYNTYIDVIHFRKADAKRLRDRDEESAEGYVLKRDRDEESAEGYVLKRDRDEESEEGYVLKRDRDEVSAEGYVL